MYYNFKLINYISLRSDKCGGKLLELMNHYKVSNLASISNDNIASWILVNLPSKEIAEMIKLIESIKFNKVPKQLKYFSSGDFLMDLSSGEIYELIDDPSKPEGATGVITLRVATVEGRNLELRFDYEDKVAKLSKSEYDAIAAGLLNKNYIIYRELRLADRSSSNLQYLDNNGKYSFCYNKDFNNLKYMTKSEAEDYIKKMNKKRDKYIYSMKQSN